MHFDRDGITCWHGHDNRHQVDTADCKMHTAKELGDLACQTHKMSLQEVQDDFSIKVIDELLSLQMPSTCFTFSCE